MQIYFLFKEDILKNARLLIIVCAVIFITLLTYGNAYAGCVEGDCINGQGTYVYSDGSQYSGGYKDGMYSGFGTLTMADGQKFSGEFVINDKGESTMTTTSVTTTSPAAQASSKKRAPTECDLRDIKLSKEEKKLYKILNKYRDKKGLPEIPLSSSLTCVAQKHVRDLMDNLPDIGKCNSHSWSDNGPWSSCCYTSDHARAKCMWDKPRELTAYNGDGYEIAYGDTRGYADAKGALRGWQSSEKHHDVILNREIWKDSNWRAVGIGMHRGYAVIWFGTETDERDQ
jgi:uncharacterized protein YkwD